MKKLFKKTWLGKLIRVWIILSKRAARDNEWLMKNRPEVWYEQMANQSVR